MIRPYRHDIILLFSTRIIRLFCYGFLSVILALYLSEAGLAEGQIGLLFTFTLLGDAAISLWLTTSADRLGRKRTLILGAVLMAAAGLVFILTRNILLLVFAAVIGVISPSGNEIGPFLSVEQASLTQLVPDRERTRIFAWYNLAGSFATATGALAGGWLAQGLQHSGWMAIESYRVVLMGYALGGVLLLLLFLNLTKSVEVNTEPDELKARVGTASLTECGFQAELALRTGCFCRRPAGSEPDCLLVPYTIWCGGGDSRQYFLRREHSCWIFCPACGPNCKTLRLDQYHGIYTYPLEYFVDDGAVDADSAPGGRQPAPTFQHLPDGCPDAPIVYHGCCCPRRAFRRFRRHCHRAFARGVHIPCADRMADRHSGIIQRPVFSIRWIEDYL